MRSIYERDLGEEFEDLHPKVRERFGFSSDDGVACVGRGRMEYVGNDGPHVYLFLLVGSTHNTMFPEGNTAVPFEVRNYAYVDEYGREVVTWLREFQMPRERRFDAAMIYSEERDRIVDYLGVDHHLAVDVDLSVSEEGGLRLRTGEQRFYRYGLSFDFPLTLSACADVHEWYDDDDEERYPISVEVTNRLFGLVFEYRGGFDVEWIDCETAPPEVRPRSATRGE